MSDPNMMKLRQIMELFHVRTCDIVRYSGYSKAYVSRALNGHLKPTSQFYMKLNKTLPALLNDIGSSCCAFQIPEPVRGP